MLAERLRQRDVQTIAVLSCVTARRGGGPPPPRLLPSAHEASYTRCRHIYAAVLRRWSLFVPLAELTKFGETEGDDALPPSLSAAPSTVGTPALPPTLGVGASSSSVLSAAPPPAALASATALPLGEISVHVVQGP